MHLCRALAVALLLAAAASADTVWLKDGRKFEGAVTDLGEEYAIKGKFGTLKIKKSDVDRVEVAPTAEYEAKSKALAADDPEGHFQLGLWCKEKGLKAEAKAEFEKAIAVDPHHEGAHRELGHSRVGDRWGTPLEMMDSVEALLRLGKADKAAEMMGPLMTGSVETLEKPQQVRAWNLMASIHLRKGATEKAADAADRAAELAVATEKVSAKTRAEIIRASGDGKFDVKSADLVSAMPGQTDPGLAPLEAGRQPLWDSRVMLIALRTAAQADIDKGRKLMNDGDGLASTDKEKAIRVYASAEDFFDHANDIVTDFGRQFQVEAVRKQIPLILELANDSVAKANKSNPLANDYGLQVGASGKVTFTGDGLARFQADKRDWNAHVGKINDCMKDISRLNNRFPAEFAKHKKVCDDLKSYYDKKIPEVREFLDKIEKALK